MTNEDGLLVDSLRNGQEVRLIASSGSMRPTILPGDTLWAIGDPPVVGDIAVVWLDGNWVAHRMLARTNNTHRLCGDSLHATVHEVSSDRVFGRVVRIETTADISDPTRRHPIACWLVRHIPSPAFVRGVLTFFRGSELFFRARQRATQLVNLAVAPMLSDEERSQITIGAYNQRGFPGTDLFQWERDWFADALPPPTARILVAAAGAGREAAALVAMGYQVDAFEPADSAIPALTRACGPEAAVACATFTDLAASVANKGRHEDELDARAPAVDASGRGNENALETIAGRRYDATLVGWGGFSHLPSSKSRRSVLAAFDRITDGPILVSTEITRPGLQRAPPRDGLGYRAWTIGCLATRWRASPASLETPILSSSSGFINPVSHRELESLGQLIGRHLSSDENNGFPHFTFVAGRTT